MNVAIAYCDGSYSKERMIYGAGGILVNDNYRFSFSGSDLDLVSMWNVGGEIAAAKHIIEYTISKGYKELHLHYDYAGIEKWCTKEWKASKKGTQDYVKFYQSVKDRIKIKFIHVKAHSGDLYNNVADKLAKDAIHS